ncbi:alpha/beta fold hydrolase [Saccharospirillum impatiens]|uniref:alpha/beta fold hydrolase n=1 Tax=Saccharospirillum impatiens TaxID=169438 RepID=UPI0004221E71|nr:alpha/beta hydrolase [Saccharospirillum impatiens]
MVPGFLSVGQGPTVVMLHSSLSSSGQWRDLIRRLRGQAHCLAMDLTGYGETPLPALDSASSFTLWQEVALLESVLEQEQIRGPLRLVGHSYGAAVALAFAQKYPERIERLVLFEPVCFSILDAGDAGLQDLESVLHVFDDTSTASDPTSQARRFIEYWNGPGAFDVMPERLQQLFTHQVKKVDLDFQALMHPTFTADALSPLAGRLTLLHGEQTRASARALIQQLQHWLPGVRVVKTPGGHMAPLSHEAAVNTQIEQWLYLTD